MLFECFERKATFHTQKIPVWLNISCEGYIFDAAWLFPTTSCQNRTEQESLIHAVNEPVPLKSNMRSCHGDIRRKAFIHVNAPHIEQWCADTGGQRRKVIMNESPGSSRSAVAVGWNVPVRECTVMSRRNMASPGDSMTSRRRPSSPPTASLSLFPCGAPRYFCSSTLIVS